MISPDACFWKCHYLYSVCQLLETPLLDRTWINLGGWNSNIWYMRWIRVMSKSSHMVMTFMAFDRVGCIVFSSLFGWGLVPYGYWILPSLFSELHAVQLHCWRKCQLNNKLTPPCDVPLCCIVMPYLHPFPCCPVKESLLPQHSAAAQRLTS